MKAQQFAIAKSSNGTLGLITSPEMVEHTYPEGKTVPVWKGVILEENTFQGRGDDSEKTIVAKVGGQWSSSNPEVVAHLTAEQIIQFIKDQKAAA